MTGATKSELGRCRASDPLGAEDRSCHIVVAEDDYAMKALVSEALRADGYEVTEATDGDELRSILATSFRGRDPRGIDLIITDNRMPRCSGLEVLALLRARDWATPVILITAFGDEDTHAEALRLGALQVLDKPFPMRKLRHVVNELLSLP